MLHREKHPSKLGVHTNIDTKNILTEAKKHTSTHRARRLKDNSTRIITAHIKERTDRQLRCTQSYKRHRHKITQPQEKKRKQDKNLAHIHTNRAQRQVPVYISEKKTQTMTGDIKSKIHRLTDNYRDIQTCKHTAHVQKHTNVYILWNKQVKCHADIHV